MRIFLDANILISVLNKEYPLFTYSSRILSLVDSKHFEVYTSPLCLAIAFYFAEKKSGTRVAKQKIALLASKIEIAENTREGVANTVGNQRINDFEDGLQHYAAEEAKCKCIVTENIDDFHFASIEVLTSQDFFTKYLVK
ncbi:MAG: type II toxin-antitoxin system VapC family toxin [Bacteroidota bacterium]